MYNPGPRQFPAEMCYFSQSPPNSQETRHFQPGERVCVHSYDRDPALPASAMGVYYFRNGSTGTQNDPYYYMLPNMQAPIVGRIDGQYIGTITPAQVQAVYPEYSQVASMVSAFHIIAVTFNNAGLAVPAGANTVNFVFPWVMVGKYMTEPSPTAVSFVGQHWGTGLPENVQYLVQGYHKVPRGFGTSGFPTRKRKVRKDRKRKSKTRKL